MKTFELTTEETTELIYGECTYFINKESANENEWCSITMDGEEQCRFVCKKCVPLWNRKIQIVSKDPNVNMKHIYANAVETKEQIKNILGDSDGYAIQVSYIDTRC